ncbi:MAG: DUF5675 family protein [Lutibacter sp.]|uniref:DUF5675 family protein n=1 Tax=Lutibacter sp. TaxID=1925666 RepID=UPI00299D1967|nr:DUF5675 family protein [Lutibacter sp.]MDX1828894.1 DUF5675 family protein [Lutibacter sp.]
MELHLHRTYYKEGTNGVLFINDSFVGFCIELPWKDNLKRVSCIPEGVYQLKARYSDKFKHHLVLQNVSNRSLILIHPANDANKELQGCIAPVSSLTGIAKGLQSRIIFQKILSACFQAFDRKEKVTLTIKN